MFNMLIKLIFYLVNSFYGIIFNPIINWLTDNIPALDDLIDNLKYFLATYVFPTLQWSKMFLINSTAFPMSLFQLLTGLFIIFVAMHLFLTSFEFALRIYNHFKP